MPTFHPIQTAFNAGEVSPRLRGRVDTPVYRAGLGFCENFRVLPQGPLLMRAGTLHEGTSINAPRLIPFRVPGVDNDYVLEITPLKLRIYERGAGLVSIKTNLISNGHFDTNLSGWTINGATWAAPGVARFEPTFGISRNPALAPGVVHTLRFKYRGQGTLRTTVNFAQQQDYVATGAFQEATRTFNPDGVINFFHAAGAGGDWLEVDDISIVSSADPGVTELTAPWGVTTLDLIQYAQSLVAAQMTFAHPAKMPRVLQHSAGDVWELYEAGFTQAPTAWRDGAAPGTVEVGFQGRTWYGGTPNVPNGLWGSKSGQPFNFDLDDSTADDALDLLISAKGTVRWIQGQKSLLVGTDATEHALTGGDGGIIKPGSYAVRDESAHGSAPVQAIHIGDQVVFVTYDRRHLRAVNYDFQENGWVSKALTFLAEHLTKPRIREIHYARSPDPTLIVLLYGNDTTVIACTYDRSQEVTAWYRLDFGAMVVSAAVAESEEGPELWIAVNRGGGYSIERMPLHEESDSFLDNSIEVIATLGSVITGLDHLNGKTVSVVCTGPIVGEGASIIATGVVIAGGMFAHPDIVQGARYAVGLPFTARAETLPLEGGNPAGTSQGLKRRFVEINLRLNDSAIPKINGKRPEERSFGTLLDAPTARVTDDVVVKNVEEWTKKGVVVIEQDLPIRTEVCALYGPVKVNV